MNIVIHVDGYYDWEPAPLGMVVKQADVDAKRVKPSQDGHWLIRVAKRADTHTSIAIPEHQVIAIIFGDKIRDHVVHTRQQAVAHYLSRLVMPHNAHRKWMKAVEVNDDGPSEELFRELLQKQVDAENIDAEDVEDLVSAYMQPASTKDHEEHLHKHFGMKGHK